jgi:broad-specificity NMP kinase
MGKKNFLVEGSSGTGKSSVWEELLRRGYGTVNGDRELAYMGDPITGEKVEHGSHDQWIWNVAKVRQLAASQDDDFTFFCGGSRNFNQFIDLFNEVFILDVDPETLIYRLKTRTNNDTGKTESELAFILRVHATKEDLPKRGIVIDATQPLDSVVDEILRHAQAST